MSRFGNKTGFTPSFDYKMVLGACEKELVRLPKKKKKKKNSWCRVFFNIEVVSSVVLLGSESSEAHWVFFFF